MFRGAGPFIVVANMCICLGLLSLANLRGMVNLLLLLRGGEVGPSISEFYCFRKIDVTED